jgi:tetratricopeptide (TPR) repeat protein
VLRRRKVTLLFRIYRSRRRRVALDVRLSVASRHRIGKTRRLTGEVVQIIPTRGAFTQAFNDASRNPRFGEPPRGVHRAVQQSVARSKGPPIHAAAEETGQLFGPPLSNEDGGAARVLMRKLHRRKPGPLTPGACLSRLDKLRAVLIFLLALALPLAAQSLSDCQSASKHGRTSDAKACYQKLAASRDPYLRGEALWALRDYQGANDAFRAAIASQPKNALYRVRWGRMYLEHWQPADAQALFQEALKIDPNNADAILGLALIAADNWEQKAAELAQAALKHNPKLVEAQELLARIALEDNNAEKAAAEADKALAISPEALDAMAIRATIDWMDDKPASPWMDRILKINPAYGEAYAMAGHFFVINRRYEEGIKFYRKALELNPELWSARSELGVNLMRLGQEEEARRQLVDCYEHGYQNPATVNSLRLLDSYKNYDTFRTSKTILRLNKKEAAVLRPYFQAELERAMATYDKKYQMKLNAPVQLEVYPNHEDFAVRTMGMPGLGALGVTFGTVVAMDSPSARPPGQFHWASTLWHELSHVYILTATQHRVPRWFTEGMAVHEETATSPDWGDRLDAHAIQAIEKKSLLPVAELDRGFVHPSYPAQVLVSYFQAGQICDYIAERWGSGRLLRMVQAFAARKTTPEVIEQELGMKPEAFDKEFLAWLEKRTKTEVDNYKNWKSRAQQVAQALGAKKYDDVIREGTAIRDLYPDYVEKNSVYEMLAEAYAAKGDKAAAMAQLAKYAEIGGRDPAILKKLAAWQQEAGRKAEAAATLARINYVYPLDTDLHSRLGALYLELGKNKEAVREFQALVAGKPVDMAGAQYQLARAYLAERRIDEARDAVVNALEIAPGYKEAQRLLLELDGKD